MSDELNKTMLQMLQIMQQDRINDKEQAKVFQTYLIEQQAITNELIAKALSGNSRANVNVNVSQNGDQNVDAIPEYDFSKVKQITIHRWYNPKSIKCQVFFKQNNPFKPKYKSGSDGKQIKNGFQDIATLSIIGHVDEKKKVKSPKWFYGISDQIDVSLDPLFVNMYNGSDIYDDAVLIARRHDLLFTLLVKTDFGILSLSHEDMEQDKNHNNSFYRIFNRGDFKYLDKPVDAE